MKGSTMLTSSELDPLHLVTVDFSQDKPTL